MFIYYYIFSTIVVLEKKDKHQSKCKTSTRREALIGDWYRYTLCVCMSWPYLPALSSTKAVHL